MAEPTCSYPYPYWQGHLPCPEPAWDDQGRCLFHSERPDKTAEEMVARVKEKLGRGDKDFAGYLFPTGTVFFGGDFGDGADFVGATFGDRADFARASFGSHANFGGAVFLGSANFRITSFGDNASFWGANFVQGANFALAKFDKDASFADATFGAAASFRAATFGGKASFWNSTFADGTRFEETTFQDSAEFNRASFGRVIFRRCKLPGAAFRDSAGLEACEFDSVTWGSRGNRQGVLGDEEVARESKQAEDYVAAERVYREIRRSYLERRDFTMARQMHWGEMEMRRRGEAARRREAHRILGWGPLAHLSLTTAYWLVSGYGQRWLNALVSLVGLWFICGVLFALLGVQFQASPGEVSHAFGDGLLQSALSLVLHPTDYAQPATAWGWLVEFLELVLSPVIITTLVLAVREQFRH